MYLDQHIAKLLEQHECVIVPDFGAFITNDRPCYINETEGKIYPSSKRLAFNPSLTFNDGLLINSISFSEKLTYQDVTDQVKKCVEQWKKTLSGKEKLLLIGIGEMVLNDDQKLIFNPLVTGNIHSESFGLSELDITPVVRKSPELASIEKEISFTLVDEEEETTNDHHHHKSVKPKKILYYSLTAYIPVIIGLWAVLYFADPFNKTNESSLNPVVSKGKPEAKAITKNESQPGSISNNEQKISRKDNMNTASVVTINESPKPIYYVIGGSFKSYKNAAVLQKEFLDKNFDSKIVKSENNQYRVTYSKFSSRTEAEQYLRTIRQSENSSAWILNERE
jgi:nucleoid DNA-binding protein